jgi:uncharacterized protein (TIGR03435 family)
MVRANYKVFMYKNGPTRYLFWVCCVVCAVAIAPMGTGFRAGAQTPSTDPAFEVATVKSVDPTYHFDGKRFWAHVSPAGASYWTMTPINLIEYAYGVESFQVTGPEWANHERFDIETRFPEGADKKDDRRMLQTLLKDRFKLAFHIEKRELEGYALVVGKHGDKLRPSLPDPVSSETDTTLKPVKDNVGKGPARAKITKNPDGSSTVDMGKRGTQTVKFDKEKSAWHYERSKMTMEELAGILSGCLGSGGHKIVDETGIKGTYQLEWDCPSATQRSATDSDAVGTLASDPQDGSSLTRSLDAFGLKLEKRKILQDVYIIDHVERPSGN